MNPDHARALLVLSRLRAMCEDLRANCSQAVKAVDLDAAIKEIDSVIPDDYPAPTLDQRTG